MTRVVEHTVLPSGIEVKLRRILRRQVGLAVARAVAVAVSVLIVAMLFAMWVDWWFTLFDPNLRLVLTLTSLSLAIAAILAIGVRPVIETFGWTRAANEADAEVPQLEERWTTISQIATSNHQPDTQLARAMLRQVASEAVVLGRLVEPARVVRVARLSRVLTLACASIAALASLLAVNWEQNSVLLRRFWAPTAAITATQLESTPGDVAIPRGQTIDIVAKLTGLQRDTATLTLENESDQSSTIVLDKQPDVPGTFTHIVHVDESFRYRVRAGDGQTEWHSITAIDPPEIAEVRFVVTAPDYVSRPPYERSLLPGRVKAIQGSQLSLAMRCQAQLERFELLLASADPSGKSVERKLQLEPGPDGWYRFESVLQNDLALSPFLSSPYGLSNEDRRVCRIQVLRDKAPVARVISPIQDMTVSPDEVLDIKFEAHDDHGIAKVELVVYEEHDDGEQRVSSVQDIPLDDQKLKKHILATTQLDLSGFDLEEGKKISYAVRVTDNRMLNLARKEVASQNAEGRELVDQQGALTKGEEAVASSTAKASDSRESAEAGALQHATENTGQMSQRSGFVQPNERSPDHARPAQLETVSQSNEQGEEAATRFGDPKRAVEIGRKSDPNKSAAETDSNGLLAGKAEKDKLTDGSVAKADRLRDRRQREQDAPTNRDSSAPTDAGKGAAHGVAASVMPPQGGAQSALPAIAATSSIPPGDADNGNVLPTGGPSIPSPPIGAGRLLADSKSGATQALDGSAPGQGSSDALSHVEQVDTNHLRPHSGSVQLSESTPSHSGTSMPPLNLDRNMRFEAQRGQNTESNRMRLRITDRLAVAAEAGKSRRSDAMNIRSLLRKIDNELEAAEVTLTELNDQPDTSQVSDKSSQIDSRLERAELIVAELRNDSKETKYEFVGLQMLDIERTHVTPARDRVFVLVQDPGSNPTRNKLEALHHTSTARDLLAALTKRFDEVARERELAEALEEVAKIYEVYVENARGVLREAQQNQNALRRKMAVVEVDEAYLKRLTQVLEMEREIMAEFARILSDDPRLMGKYMDMIKRRDGNLRNRLTDLRELQEDIVYEVGGWLRVDEAQRPDVWLQVAEMRLLAGKDLAKAASQLEARTRSQFPLNLEPSGGIGGKVIKRAREVALKARQGSLQASRLMKDALENDEAKASLVDLADQLKDELIEFDAALDQLAFEHEEDEEVTDFTTRRLAESRGVAELAIAWAEVASHVRRAEFHGLAAVDQQKLAIDTDRLRIDMSNIEDDLATLFQPDDVPVEVAGVVRELMKVMERITFNQTAATFELNHGRLQAAEAQQTMASEGFERAEELFDNMRRATVDILDERDADNPNIADLEDPTLDEFLERLEREPNLNQLLGIPNRPSNLRVIRDWMLWQAQGAGIGGGGVQQAAANAMQRAQMMAQGRYIEEQTLRRLASDDRLTEEEMEEFARAEDMEEEMEKMLRAIEEKMKDPATDVRQREELQKKAQMLVQLLAEAREGGLNREKWEELANADEMKAMMEALANGEPIPDSQWNRLLSTLDTGLWQVRGRTPPEDYRRAIEQYQDQIRRLLNAGSRDEI